MTLAGWLSGVAVVLGVMLLALSVYGLARLPDVYMRLHSAGKAATFGVLLIAVAAAGTGDVWLLSRALLIAVFLLITAPVSAHAVGLAAFIRKEAMAAPEVHDDSGRVRGSEEGRGDGG